jgi:hypothetical protein
MFLENLVAAGIASGGGCLGVCAGRKVGGACSSLYAEEKVLPGCKREGELVPAVSPPQRNLPPVSIQWPVGVTQRSLNNLYSWQQN